MRRWLFLLLCITLAAVICPVTAEEGEASAESLEKSVQTDDEIEACDGLADSVEGTVSITTPTWNRVFSTADADPECGMTSLLSGFGELPYITIQITVPGTEDVRLEAVVDGSLTDLEDTILAVYCAPFDPEFPQLNLLAYDDDDGLGALSAFSADDGVILKPGETYVLVLSPFRWHLRENWGYKIDFCTPDVTVPVELQRFTVE